MKSRNFARVPSNLFGRLTRGSFIDEVVGVAIGFEATYSRSNAFQKLLFSSCNCCMALYSSSIESPCRKFVLPILKLATNLK